MTPEEMAAIHAASFTRPRPWNDGEFAGLLREPTVFAITVPDAFILGRCVLDEAELLTLAVVPAARRNGTGRRLVARFATEATRRGARTAFLEVAADNRPALALYAATGWRDAGRRRGYYGDGVDAVIMRKALNRL